MDKMMQNLCMNEMARKQKHGNGSTHLDVWKLMGVYCVNDMDSVSYAGVLHRLFTLVTLFIVYIWTSHCPIGMSMSSTSTHL